MGESTRLRYRLIENRGKRLGRLIGRRQTGQARLGLEAAEEADDERVVDESEDVPLGEHLLNLVTQDQRGLPHALHREPPASVAVPHQIHSSAHELGLRCRCSRL